MHCFFIKLPLFISLLVLLQHLICCESIAKVPDKLASEIPEYASGRIVDSIEIDNRNVFEVKGSRLRRFVFQLANRLHWKTRENVIRREVLFTVGEPFPVELAEETTRNLRNFLQLYDAWIETDTLTNGNLLVRVVTVDEWTLSIGPGFSREGNKSNFDLTASDRNLFGLNKYLLLGYAFQDMDDDYFSGQFINQRFFGRSVSIDTRYSDNPAERIKKLAVYRPFYNLKQKSTWDIIWGSSDNRQDIYNDSMLIGQYRSKTENFTLRFGRRFGSYHRKLMLSWMYIYNFEKAFDTVTISNNQQDIEMVASALSHDSVYHVLGARVIAANLNFAKLRQIDGIQYTEDFALGQTVDLTVGRAFLPGFRDHVWDRIDVRLSQGYRFLNNLAYITYSSELWFRSNENLRKLTSLSLYYYSYQMDFVTFASHSSYYSDWRSDETEGVSLGGENGIRGYGTHFKTGNRRAVFNAELRFFPKLEILSAIFSPAVFIDGGRTWKQNEELSWRDFYFSGGIGLRTGIGHSSRDRIIRVDLTFSEYNRWQLSIGFKQYFEVRGTSLLLTTY
ncbi:MAG: hypothetical protein DRP47_03570 [Candidatus Zixiibacteriota bacterium]|nr:MAG: hypothetical protein DRP47_03570 [candidate division Zixibacteria bacterium]